jgi:hypothetical protein
LNTIRPLGLGRLGPGTVGSSVALSVITDLITLGTRIGRGLT